jgi:pilus assembly protein CpaF
MEAFTLYKKEPDMAVPPRPPVIPQKPVPPIAGQIPSKPVRPTDVADSVIGKSFRGASMDEKEEAFEKEAAERLEKIARINNVKARGETTFRSDLKSDDLIVNNWFRYEHLMPKVVEVKTWLTEILTQENRTLEIAQAREERGRKYDEMYSLIEHLLTRYFMSEKVVSNDDSKILMALVANEVLGLGPIEPLWRDPRISEIMVNGPYKVRVEMGGRLMDVPGARFRNAEHLLDVCQQMLAPINRAVDVAHPLQDGSLPDGSRLNIVHPGVASAGPYLTIRKFPERVISLAKLIEYGSMNEQMAADLGNYIAAGMSTVVIGGTGSGKTSMLNALSSCVPPGDRVLVIEDTPELRLHPDRDILYLQARPALQEGKGAVTIRDLVKNALRMRPDRIVVGEVRGFEAYDMLQAMNTGHDGSMTTVHANDAKSGVERLVNLLSEGGDDAVDSSRVLSLISSGVDLFVTIRRYEDGSRRCSGIYEIPNEVIVDDGNVTLTPRPLWEFRQTGTGENNEVIGDWFPNEEGLSQSMIDKHRYNHRYHMSLQEIYDTAAQADDPS